MHGTTSEMK